MVIYCAADRCVIPEHRHHNEQIGMLIRGQVTFRTAQGETLSADLVVSNAIYHDTVWLKVDRPRMNQAVFAFRRYEDASLRYTGIESHEGLTHYGLYDTVVARE